MEVALCGEKQRTDWMHRPSDHFQTDEGHVTCPACLKKLAARKLKALRASGAGPALALEPDPEARGGFRHGQGTRVLLDGELVGYVGYQDHHWRVYPLVVETYDDEAKANGPYARLCYQPLGPDGRPASHSMYGLRSEVPRYKTKLDAAMACVELREKGWLKPGPELLADHAAEVAEAAAEREAYRQEARDRRAALETTLAGLRSIARLNSLSDEEHAALHAAIDRYAADLRPRDAG